MADGRNIPKYERSVPVEVTAQPDVGGTFNMMIGAFQRFSSAVSEISSEVSKQGQIQQRSILQHNISTTYSEFADAALNEPDPNKALVNYDQSVKSYNQQLLKQTGYFNKDYVESLTDYFGQIHREPIFKNSLAANKRMLQGDFAMYDDSQTQNINDAISKSSYAPDEKTGVNMQFTPAIAFYKEQQKNRYQGFLNGTITPKEYEASKKQGYDNLMQGIAIKSFKDHLMAGKGSDFWKDFNDGTYSAQLEAAGLPAPSEKQLEITGNILKGVERQFKTQAGNNKAEVRRQMARNIKSVTDGGTPNDKVADDVLTLFPEEYDSYQQKVLGAHENYATKKDTLYMSPSQVSEKVEALKPTDPNDPLYVDKKESYEATKAAVLSQEKAIRDDPVAFAQKDPTVLAAAANEQQNKNTQTTGTNFQGTPFNIHSPNATDAIMNWQTVKGIPLNKQKVMLNDKAKEMVSAFQLSDDAGKIGLFNQLRADYPTDVKYKLAFKQLVENGMDADYSTLVNYDMNDPEARKVVAAIGIKVEDQKKLLSNDAIKKVDDLILKGKNTSLYHSYINTPRMASYFDSIRALQTTDAGQFAVQVDSSMQHLTYYAMTSGIASTPEKAYEWASDRVTHGMQFGSLGGQTIRAPQGVTMSNVYSYAQKQERTAVRQYPFAVPQHVMNQGLLAGSKNRERISEDYLKVIRNGHWATNDMMTGLVWSSPNGEVPTDKNGQPLQFLYSDAEGYTGNSVLENQDIMNNALMGNTPKDYSPNTIDQNIPTSAVPPAPEAPKAPAKITNPNVMSADEQQKYDKIVRAGKKANLKLSPEVREAIKGSK